MINQYVHNFCRIAREHGISKLNFYLESSYSRDLSVYNGELESLVLSEQNQLFIEGLIDGRGGSVFVENLDESLIPEHIRAILDSAEACPKEFLPYHLEGLDHTPTIHYTYTDLDETVAAICRAEQAAYAFDPRVSSGVQVHVKEFGRRFMLSNENEEFATDIVLGGNAGIHLAARDGDLVQPGGRGQPFRGRILPDMDKLARIAAEGAVTRLGAGSYQTGNFPVVLDARVVGELLDAFMPTFFARNVQTRMSSLAGRMHQRLGSSMVSILEDPGLVEGFSSRRFDDEGVPTRPKAIVDQGVLSCWLYNRQSAEADGVSSTGNGFKGQFKDSVATGYTNVYIPGGSKTRAELLEQMGDGLLITGVSGVFAGAKPNSGDFSLISSGYRVEGGKIGKGVTQITISANFFDMLQNVVDVANDEHWMCTSSGNIRTPSVRLSGLNISGKE